MKHESENTNYNSHIEPATAPRCDKRAELRERYRAELRIARTSWARLESDGWNIEPPISAAEALAELQRGAYTLL